MNKIGTHNSATGEKSASWFDRLITVFARCQDKTLKEQWEAGCRFFDIRYKWSNKRGCYVCAHGLRESVRTLSEVLKEIDEFGKCYVMVTCETGAPLTKAAIRHIINLHTNICFTQFERKLPRWKCDYCNKPVAYDRAYRVLDWSTWHTLLPIPRLWRALSKPVDFNADKFKFVDFL